MNAKRNLSLALAAGACLLVAVLLPAERAAHAQALAREASTPEPVKSPVATFRELLAMGPAERKQALTNRPPAIQKLILAKIREYESLKPEQRELRLRVTELRWYLMPLLTEPSTNRAAMLALVPKEYRQPVQQRLIIWSLLPPGLRSELLTNDLAIRYMVATGDERTNLLSTMSPGRQEQLKKSIAQWQSLPEDQREKIMARFSHFFDLSPMEKKKALNTLSATEQQQIEKTLRTFGDLSPLQRARCIHSFEKFANLSLEERQEFLKNAERWSIMGADERQAWRELVQKVSTSPSFLKLPRPARPSVPGRNPPVDTNGD
jgi:predicted Fe-S protein YdhL (DUF1289 family)